METAPHQGVGGDLPLADERVTLQHLDARGPPQDGGEQRGVGGVGRPSERRVQGQEPGARAVKGILFWD